MSISPIQSDTIDACSQVNLNESVKFATLELNCRELKAKSQDEATNWG